MLIILCLPINFAESAILPTIYHPTNCEMFEAISWSTMRVSSHIRPRSGGWSYVSATTCETSGLKAPYFIGIYPNNLIAIAREESAVTIDETRIIVIVHRRCRKPLNRIRSWRSESYIEEGLDLQVPEELVISHRGQLACIQRREASLSDMLH